MIQSAFLYINIFLLNISVIKFISDLINTDARPIVYIMSTLMLQKKSMLFSKKENISVAALLLFYIRSNILFLVARNKNKNL